jgi:integrase/recombinase XerD
MPSLKDNKTCALLEQYLNYLVVVKGCSPLTAEEYRIDCLMFFEFIKHNRGGSNGNFILRDFKDVDIDFIKSITVSDMYNFSFSN